MFLHDTAAGLPRTVGGSSSRSAAERLISVVPFPLGVPVPHCPRPSAGRPLLHAFRPAVWFPPVRGWVLFLFSHHSCGPESGIRDLIHGPWALHLCLLTGLLRRCSVSGPPPPPISHTEHGDLAGYSRPLPACGLKAEADSYGDT